MIKQLFTVILDIRNLYSSRDGLWKEVFKLQQTSKRRDKALRQRIHILERRLHELGNRKEEAFETAKN